MVVIPKEYKTMKAIKYILASLAIVMTCSSCLEANLKELDTFTGNLISSTFVYYRYVDASVTYPLSGAHGIKQAALDVTNDINNDAGTCVITATVPSNFPADQLSKLSAKELVVAVQVSAAAVVAPMDGSPALGTPSDWSSPHKYVVTAANGDSKEWTITVKLQL